jgi:hypothetical protein
MDPWVRTPHSLSNQATSQVHTFTCSYTAQYFHSIPWTWMTLFHPPKGRYLGAFWELINSPSASWGRPEFESRFLPVWWVGLPGWSPSLSRLLFATGTCLLSSPGERLPPPDQCGLVAPGRGSPPGRLGMLSWWQGAKTPPSKSWAGPQQCCRRAQIETERAPKLSGSKFIKQASSYSVDSCPKAEHQEQRWFSLYTM